jgi:hypothetical protein
VKTCLIATLLTLAVACVAAQTASAQLVKCKLAFTLKGWSIAYKTAKGSGTITCDNGKSARVTLSTKGGGFTVGKSTISNGRGEFSEVASIDELFGSYATADASAGAVRSSDAQVLTKGNVSLALSGTGSGWDLGISFGAFRITKRK